MSKKHYEARLDQASLSHVAEYKIIKHDLIKVVILNALYFAGVIALYFSNKQSGFLEKWFAKIFNF